MVDNLQKNKEKLYTKQDTYDKYGQRERIPLHRQKRVGIKQKPGFVRALINDIPGQIQAMLDAGWTFVTDEDQLDVDQRMQQGYGPQGSKYMPVVNLDPKAPCKYAIWMEMPQDLYDQDVEDFNKVIEEKERMLEPQKLREDPNVFSGVLPDYIKNK